MPSPSPSPSANPQPGLDLSQLRAARPVTPEKAFLDEANNKVAQIVNAVGSKILSEMTRDNYKQIQAIADHSNQALTADQRSALITQAAKNRVATELATLPPLYADYTAALKRHGVGISSAATGGAGLDPSRVEAVVKDHMAKCVDAEVTAKMTEAYKQLTVFNSNEERRKNVDRSKFFAGLIDNPKSPFDLNEWISKSGLKDPANQEEKLRFNEDLTKLRQSGVWHDPDPAQAAFEKYRVKEGEIKNHRKWMNCSWVVTVTGLAAMASIAPVGLLFYAPIALTVNYLIQKYHGFNHDQKFDTLFDEINRELKDAGPMEAGIAWAGVMHKFLQDYRPWFCLSDRTKLLNGHKSLSIDAALRQLRQAASYGADSILRRDNADSKQTFFKDSKFNDYIKQNDAAMEALAKRVKFYTKYSVPISNPFKAFKKVMVG